MFAADIMRKFQI